MPMLFQTFAETLEALEPISGRLQMIAMLADTLRQAEPDPSRRPRIHVG